MKNNKALQRLIIVSTLAVIAICGYLYFTYYINSLTQKTANIKSDIQLSEIKYTRLEILRKATENTSDQKSRIEQLFVGQSGAVDFIGKIEDMAKNSGLTYKTDTVETEPMPGSEDLGKELVTINMTTTGLWSNTIKFLKLIESLPYSVKVNNIRLNVVKGAAANVSGNAGTSVSTNTGTSESSNASSTISTTMPTINTTVVQNKWVLDIEFSVVKIK